MAESQAQLFFNTFCIEELEFPPPQTWRPPASDDSNMFMTPSPSASSLSGPFSPTLSDENEMYDYADQLHGTPSLHILEQPVSKFRFRYRSEMQGAHGSLLGRGETPKKKSYPTVQLRNFEGEAFIRCLLYTSDSNPRPHMHQLISKEGSKEVLDHEIVVSERNDYRAEFKCLGIVHMSKKDLKKELVRKYEIKYLEDLRTDKDLAQKDDETLKGALKLVKHELEKKATKAVENMDPNKVKLCFEAYQKGPNGEVYRLCKEVFSDTIQNMKSAETGELKICRMDRVAGSCLGGDEIYILVEKVCKKNIRVRFFELDEDDKEVWSDLAQFSEHDVHHQYAIVFKTPQFRKTDISVNVEVKVELLRPRDNAKSEAITFTFKPTRLLAKRTCRSISNSESFSSIEGPKRSRHPGMTSTDDPMLSESETSINSNLSSLHIPSDAMIEFVMNDLGPRESADVVEQFCQFLQSGDYQNFTTPLPPQYQAAEDIPLPQSGPQAYIGNSPSTLQSPDLETFGELNNELDHEMDVFWKSDSLPAPLQKLRGGLAEGTVVADCANRRALPQKNLRNEKQMDGTASLAKTAYSKLLKLMKSRHPSRLQDMKNIIQAEDQEYGPLHSAVVHGQLKELSDLLSLIIKSNLLKLINTKDQRGKTPLMVAAEENQVDCLKLLCMARADLNLTDHKDNTALHIAARNRHSDCLKKLLTLNASKDGFPKTELDRKNEKGETALHIAVTQKSLQCTKELCVAGADLNAKTGTAGQTPLHLAVELDCEDIVNYLLCQETINPNEVNFNKKMAQDLIKPSQKRILSLFQRNLNIGDQPAGEESIGSDDEDEEDEEDEDEDEEEMCENDDENMLKAEEEEEDNDDEFEDADDNIAFDDGTDDDDDNRLKIAFTEDEDDEESLKNSSRTITSSSPTNTKSTSVSTAEGKDVPMNQNQSLLNPTTIDVLVNNLDSGEKWKLLCENLNCKFLVGSFLNMRSPTHCLIEFLEFDKKVSLPEFMEALQNLDVPEAVKAVQEVIEKSQKAIKPSST